MRLYITCAKTKEGFDGENMCKRKKTHLATKEIHTFTKHIIEKSVNEQLEELTTKMKHLTRNMLKNNGIGL